MTALNNARATLELLSAAFFWGLLYSGWTKPHRCRAGAICFRCARERRAS